MNDPQTTSEVRRPNIDKEMYYCGLGYEILPAVIVMAILCILTKRWPTIWVMCALGWFGAACTYGYFAVYKFIEAHHGTI